MTDHAAIAHSLASQRVAGRGRLAVAADGSRTRLRRLYQEGAAKLRMPRPEGDLARAPLQAVLINTAGGLTGGDRLAWDFCVGAGARLVATTQACEKIYRAASGEAAVGVRVEVGAGGTFAWLPQETILFDRSALSRRLDIELEPGAAALVVEAVLFGRKARGEDVSRALFRDRWRVRRRGRLVHAEDFSIGPKVVSVLAAGAAAGGGAALATLLLVRDDASELLAPVRDVLGRSGGASAWEVGGTGKLLARIVAEDGYALRRTLVPLVRRLAGEAGLPRIWAI